MIYRCIPQRVERLWGSLPPVRPGAEPVGEIWWFCQNTEMTGENGSYVEAASFFPGEGFPVILKTLHPGRDLSVQVHPGKDRVPPIKDESWAVLEGSGRILQGIGEGVSPVQFAAAVKNGTVEEVLQSMEAHTGDIFHLPAGTVHALGGGLTVLEIQLNCTITYRLWDYDRRDPSGKPRDLHVEDGLKAVDWSRYGRAFRVSEDFLDAGSYTLKRNGPGRLLLDPFSLAYQHCTGQCLFADGNGGCLETSGETWTVRIGNGS